MCCSDTYDAVQCCLLATACWCTACVNVPLWEGAYKPGRPATCAVSMQWHRCSLQVTHLDQILLNGNNIALLVPGGKPDDA